MSEYENVKQRVLNAYTVLGGGFASPDVILKDSQWMLKEIERLLAIVAAAERYVHIRTKYLHIAAETWRDLSEALDDE
jgi:hypothetical protein